MHTDMVFEIAEDVANELHLDVLRATYGFTGGRIAPKSKQGISFVTKSETDVVLALRFHRKYPCMHARRRAQWRLLYRA